MDKGIHFVILLPQNLGVVCIGAHSFNAVENGVLQRKNIRVVTWVGFHTDFLSLPDQFFQRILRIICSRTIRKIDVSTGIITTIVDADGNLIGMDPLKGYSGKFFQEGIKPRSIDEFVVGYDKQISSAWTGRIFARHRKGKNFWEDTDNDARSRYDPPEGIPQELYVPNLDEIRAEIGGSSYVIAALDGAFTKYYEISTEAEWRGRNAFFRGSYVWSHYYGNFDQDNSTTSNDSNIFVGSSFIADGAGRQLWDFREGNLRGDRRHQLKAYGYYQVPWNGTFGAYGVYQSGQPWETWDVEVYRHLTGSSSDTSRYAEPAGSRTTDSHYQLDLSYTQDFPIGNRFNIQLVGDVFNVTDNQTGYNIQNKKNSAGFGDPRTFFNPRRFQLMVRFLF